MKAYVKPDLFCEDYVLTMTIANCSNKVDTTTRHCVAIDFGGETPTDVDLTGVEVYCYTNNVQAVGIFNS